MNGRFSMNNGNSNVYKALGAIEDWAKQFMIVAQARKDGILVHMGYELRDGIQGINRALEFQPKSNLEAQREILMEKLHASLELIGKSPERQRRDADVERCEEISEDK